MSSHSKQSSGGAMTEQEEKLFSMVEMARFSSGIAAYRIVRLSVELFLVVRVQELDFSVSSAGTIYLLYSLASIFAGLLFIWFPSICFGSLRNALAYFGLSVVFMFGGFVGTFHVETFGWMVAYAIAAGFGTATWNVNFQTITNISFPKSQLGSVARMRQLFECIGFLVPSICLAIITTQGSASNQDDGQSFVTLTAAALAAVGFGFSLLSADQIIRCAARIQRRDDSEEGQMGIWEALRRFFGTSVVKFFLLNSMLLAFSNILMGTMSLITELYFGLDPEWLWLAAIGFPIGGLISVVSAMKSPLKKNSKVAVLSGLQKFILLLAVCILLGFTAFPLVTKQLAQLLLFFFGLAIGMIYSTTFAASIELWLLRLKECSTNFVSRASVINNLAVQAIIASIFQLQTILVDAVMDADEGGRSTSVVFFGPLIGLCFVCVLLARSVPYPKDSVFGWPMPCTFSPVLLALVGLLERLGLSASANSLFFSKFYDFRTASFAVQLEDTSVQRGPAVAEGASLKPTDLEEHLKQFDSLGTLEKWWASEGDLCDILIDNEEALEKRLELIQQATSKIFMVTWLIEHSPTGEKLAHALMKRAQEGIEVKVMVDKVTLYYLHQKHMIRGMNDMQTLEKLAQSGVQVRMLDTVHEDSEPSFVIGNHRKILLVDDKWMLTGGRNNSDRYFTTRGYHYHDADVVLQGSFGTSTGVLYNSLWESATEIGPLFGQTPKASKPQEEADKPTLFSEPTGELSLIEEDGITITDLSATELENCEEGNSTSSASSVCKEDKNGNRRGNIAVIQLDHAAGNKEGYDITFTSLLYLIETAQERIDLVMGYVQLFPELETAIRQAVERGVQIRLATNSDLTNGLPGLNNIFREALERLLEIGVEVYVTANLAEYKEDGDFCLHYKLGVFDQKAAMVGSWNCIGTSVFYDSDYSVVLFDQSDAVDNMFQPFEDLIDSGVELGRLVHLEEVAKGTFQVPFYYYPLSSKYGIRTMRQGF